MRVALLVAGTLAGAVLVGLAGPAGAVQVSTEAELRAAFATDTSIDVEADITLTDCTDGGDVAREAGVTDPVTIDGHGHTIRQTCPQRVFFQGGSGLMTVRNLTITGGNSPVSANGGGILSASPLTLESTTMVENRAGGAGGGIASDGPTTITGSTIDSNISNGIGGGISTGPSAHTLAVTNSTVSNNVGGGIGTPANDPEAAVTVVNSTIAGNRNGGSSLGSGIFSSGSTTLVYATLVDNIAGNFGNIFTTTLESFGSVIAESGGTGNCFAKTTSHGYNFSDDDLCGFTEPTDRENAGDPQLGTLADNGGPTRTRLPQPGSPLIDVIPIASCQDDGAAGIATDQRGVGRPQGSGCDIGAVEVEVFVPPVPPAPPPAPVIVTPRFTG
jgi:parallel beta helix pectate lyase-like protein